MNPARLLEACRYAMHSDTLTVDTYRHCKAWLVIL